jgi:large subunit ribosomal protein L15
MKYHELSVAPRVNRKRVGRGIAAGQGKTAGRGTKGQKARTGSSKRPGFEGGQNPLLQRLPKLPGFRSSRTAPENVYTGQLQSHAATVTNLSLSQAGLVSNPHVRVKLLDKGELTQKLTVKLQAASAGAIKVIEKAGGTFSITPQVGRPQTSQKKQSKIA